MSFVSGLIIGMIVGGCAGIIISDLCVAASRAEELGEEDDKDERS